ncbi:MAG: hypothetical protein ACKOGH_02390 [Alphaproteobacteria bacterium]
MRMDMDWFETLVGFRERGWKETRALLEMRGERLVSRANGASHGAGRLEMPTLGELRARLAATTAPRGATRVAILRGDARALHREAGNTAALSAAAGGSRRVLLTSLGGGAFGNDLAWILAAMRRALGLARGLGLDVAIVSYAAPDPALARLAAEFDG